MFDVKTMKLIKTIDVPTGFSADGIYCDTSNDRVYIGSHPSKSLMVVDATDGTVLGNVDLGGTPEQTVADGKGTVYQVLQERPGSVAVVDAKTMKVTKTYPFGDNGGCNGLALSTKWELVEWSLCPVPANPEAIRTLHALGLSDPEVPPQRLRRQSRAALPAVEKAGRVLSARNEADLRQAVALVQGVLAQVDADVDGHDDAGTRARARPPVPIDRVIAIIDGVELTTSMFRSAFRTGVAGALTQVTGMIDLDAEDHVTDMTPGDTIVTDMKPGDVRQLVQEGVQHVVDGALMRVTGRVD